MKTILDVLAYDRVRHVIDTFEFGYIEPDEKLIVTIRGRCGDKRAYTIYGKPFRILSSNGVDVESMKSLDDVRADMSSFDKRYITHIETRRTKKIETMANSSREINRIIDRVHDDYTKMKLSVICDNATTSAQIYKDDKYEMIFQTFVNADIPFRSIVELYKRVKCHKIATGWIKRTLLTVCPYMESFVTLTTTKEKTLFDRDKDIYTLFLHPCVFCVDQPFHDELVQAAWHPDRMRNCFDEHDLDYWQK
jgi:hypothetical protein